MDFSDLYQQVILDHNRSPRNFGELPEATHEADGHNPLCGDRLTVYLQVENDAISAIRFVGEGCAISKASASIMTEHLKGKSVVEAEAWFTKVHNMLTGSGDAMDLGEFGKLAALSGVCEFPVRVKCASLAWHTMTAALAQETKASTE
ncbi:MAG: nitrogen fixation NifU-like protein [Rhodothermales bacterium]|jgi:nitrogen fixation NifU-like protein